MKSPSSNDINNSALADRRRHVAGLLREQLKNKANIHVTARDCTTGSTRPSDRFNTSAAGISSPPPIRYSITAALARSRGSESSPSALHLDRSDAYDQVLESDQRPLWLLSSNNEEQKMIKYLAQKGTATEHEAFLSPLSQINDCRVHHAPYSSDDDIFHQGQEGHFCFTSNSHKSSMSPMIITVPTMVDDNDTVLTSSTSDEQMKGGKAAGARTEKEVIVEPLNVCANTDSEMQEPISVKVRAMLYSSKHQKFPYAQSPKSVLPSDLDTRISIVNHERKAEQGGTRAANQRLPTYFTPTRC